MTIPAFLVLIHILYYRSCFNFAKFFIQEISPFVSIAFSFLHCRQSSLNSFQVLTGADLSNAHFEVGCLNATKYDLTSLRVLGSVGEPINSEAWNWYYTV
eukprot:EG_transcript_44803